MQKDNMRTLAYASMGRRMRMWGVALAGLLACAGTARAEIDVEIFGGGKFYSGDGILGRKSPSIIGDPNSAFRHSGLIGLRLGYVPIPRLAIEAEIGASPTRTGDLFGTQPSVTVIPFRAHALVNILTGRLRPFVLLGGGGEISSPLGSGLIQTDVVGELHAGAGAKFDVRPNWGLRLEGRFLLVQGIERALVPEGEVFLGVYGRFSGAKPVAPVDGDADGVLDKEDACPTVFGPVVNGGCPDKDTDGDELVDRLDRCPNKAGPAENGGCADEDKDGDGVVDRLDRCPTIIGGRDSGGCPPRDGDGDGIPDKDDRCPEEAGVPDNGGCADKDVDNDGVVDRLDKCPDQPETKNNFSDEDGCPDELPKALQQFTGAIQGINFQAGKAVITAGSFKVLDKAVQVLKDNPGVKLEISGHTDNSGDAQKNRELSLARAEAVRKYLIDKGVDGGHLKAVGHGPDKPLGDNATAAGRTKNRRVEFTLVQ